MITKEKIEKILESNESCIDGYYHAVSDYDKVADEILAEVNKDSGIHDVSSLLRKYMEQVISCEGISFMPLKAGERHYDQPVFTQEEVDYLERLHDEISDC